MKLITKRNSEEKSIEAESDTMNASSASIDYEFRFSIKKFIFTAHLICSYEIFVYAKLCVTLKTKKKPINV